MTNEQKLVEMVEKFQTDPIAFFKFMWEKDKIWSKMEDICHSVVVNNKTPVEACHSSSKTHTAGKIVCWWMSCFKPSIVVTTAPTGTQVEMLLWGEIRKSYRNAKFKLGGNMLPAAPLWKIAEDHYAIGLSTKEPDRFQGFHCENGRVLVVFDEASGIPKMIWDSLDALLVNPNTRFLAIGNPLRPTGDFYDLCRKSPNRIRISGYEAVKFSKDIPGLISQEYLDDQRAKWEAGNNPLYEPRCLGEPPTISIDNVMNAMDIETAMENPVIETGSPEVDTPFFSIDWAYGGLNETVVKHWKGGKEQEKLKFSKKEPEDTIGRVVVWIKARAGRDIYHDNCGGGAICGSLLRGALGIEYTIHDIDSNGEGDDTYENLRAKMWFNAKDMLHTGGIALLNDPVTKEQLMAVTYFHNKKGRILIASKADIKKDYNINLDDADCTVYGLWGLKMIRESKPEHKKEWNWFNQSEPRDSRKDLIGIAQH